jgi:hypothetical protein
MTTAYDSWLADKDAEAKRVGLVNLVRYTISRRYLTLI